jgi:hypothetical protein
MGTAMKRTNTVPFTETETEKETEIPFANANGLRASQVVAEYSKVAKATGHLKWLDPKSRAILGAFALRLIRSDEWSPELVLRAVRKYAETDRNPLYLEEWVRSEFADEREAAHSRRKKQEPKDGGLRSLFAAIRDVQS